EMGPGAGVNGGVVVHQGKTHELKKSKAATTLDHKIKINKSPRGIKNYYTIKGVNNNNLKNIDVSIPKNVLVSVCGVSGSGKSSLMLDAFAEKYPETIRSEVHTSELQSRFDL